MHGLTPSLSAPWNYCSILRDGGLYNGDCVEQFDRATVAGLFLKTLGDKRRER